LKSEKVAYTCPLKDSFGMAKRKPKRDINEIAAAIVSQKARLANKVQPLHAAD
jgi:hypothetical protein